MHGKTFQTGFEAGEDYAAASLNTNVSGNEIENEFAQDKYGNRNPEH